MLKLIQWMQTVNSEGAQARISAQRFSVEFQLYIKILEVNLFAFAYRLFRRDFSPLDGTYCSPLDGTYCNMSRRVGRNLYETVCRQMQTN